MFSNLFPDFPATPKSRPTDEFLLIDYSPDYLKAHYILQWVMERQERSPRVIHLLNYIIEECEGHFTAWSYRRKCLDLRDKENVEKEMNWIIHYTRTCPKNYQLWQHRMHIFKALSSLIDNIVQEELDAIVEELDRNPKNYHAWQYRQWILSGYPFDHNKEFEFILKMIRQDSWNNSCYNHLVFLENINPKYILPADLANNFMHNECGKENMALNVYLKK